MLSTRNNASAELVAELNGLLADHMALYFKTKNFHWHVSGARFRELHLMFDEQALELQSQVDLIAERVRKLGAATLTSIGSIAAQSQVKDQDALGLSAEDMLAELRDDNAALLARIKGLRDLVDQAGDNATAGLIDGWTDMAEQRVWFLSATLD